MNRIKRVTSRSRKNYSPTEVDIPMVRWQLASSLQDRLGIIYGRANPRYILRLVQQARNYQELIRRYSNDSML